MTADKTNAKNAHLELQSCLMASIWSAGKGLTPTEVLGSIEVVKAAYIEDMVAKTVRKGADE